MSGAWIFSVCKGFCYKVGVHNKNLQILYWMSKPKVEDMIHSSDAVQQPPSAGKQCMTRMKIKVAYGFIILFGGGGQ